MLTLKLFGKPQILIAGQPVTNIKSSKAQALLFYLALTRQPYSRQKLAGLLWSDSPDARARGNLRVALNKLRGHLTPYLIIHRRTLSFNRDSDHDIDIIKFEACLQQPQTAIKELQYAADLYRGDFLEDFLLYDAPLFQEWKFAQRERLRQIAIRTLLQLTDNNVKQGSIKAGLNSATRLLELEPWLEEGHRQIMQLLAMDGQRSAALAQYDICFELLLAELGVEPSDTTTRLYEQISLGEIGPESLGDRLATVAITTSAQRHTPFQAPQKSPHFVGRHALLQQLVDMLSDPVSPVLHALVGMGGVGKTSLALQAAHNLRPIFADGLVWANMAVSDPFDVLEGWGQAFGFNLSGLGDLQSRAAAWRGIVADKQLLLILDDVRSVSRIRPLLPGSDNAKVLITTRDLDLVHTLHAQPLTVEVLSAANARELLTHILGESRIRPEPQAADETCALLEYLPLAVEITAQRLASRPRRRLTDMAARLRHETDKLSVLQISDQAVRSSFAVSWEPLDGRLQESFALLAIFAGRSFSPEAFAAIAEADPFAAEDRLFALVALSLLNETGRYRYQQHALLAEFAREKLATAVAPRLRMAHYYQKFAAQNQADYDALRPEWDNMMAGMELAYTQGDLELTHDYAVALNNAWFTRGRYSEARRGYVWVCELAIQQSNQHILATSLLHWGRACIEQTDYSEAKDHLEKSAEIFEQLGQRSAVADIWYQLAKIALEQGEYRQANKLFTKSFNVKQQFDDIIGTAAALYGQANVAHHQGNYILAKTLCKRAQVLQESITDLRGLLQTIRLLADCALAEKDLTEANEYCQQALALCKKTKQQDELAAINLALAVINYQQGNYDRGVYFAEQSLNVFTQTGERRAEGVVLYQLSLIHEGLEAYELAFDTALQSQEIFDELHDQYHQSLVLLHLGDLYRHQKNLNMAKDCWQTALAIAQSAKHEILTAAIQKRLTL